MVVGEDDTDWNGESVINQMWKRPTKTSQPKPNTAEPLKSGWDEILSQTSSSFGEVVVPVHRYIPSDTQSAPDAQDTLIPRSSAQLRRGRMT